MGKANSQMPRSTWVPSRTTLLTPIDTPHYTPAEVLRTCTDNMRSYWCSNRDKLPSRFGNNTSPGPRLLWPQPSCFVEHLMGLLLACLHADFPFEKFWPFRHSAYAVLNPVLSDALLVVVEPKTSDGDGETVNNADCLANSRPLRTCT